MLLSFTAEFFIDIVQWLGCATGVAGSLLLAINTRHSGWGFVLFLLSNVFLALFAIETHAPGLFTMQLIFSATSILGIYRWLGSHNRGCTSLPRPLFRKSGRFF